MITIFNVTYADEGKYSCHWFCEKDNPSVFRSSTIQLKVVTGMNNCVIISSAFSKGVRVGEIFRYKEEGGKKINAEKMSINDRWNLQLEPIQCVPVTRNLSLHFELLFCKETIVQCVVPENIHTPHGGQLGFDRFCYHIFWHNSSLRA